MRQDAVTLQGPFFHARLDVSGTSGVMRPSFCRLLTRGGVLRNSRVTRDEALPHKHLIINARLPAERGELELRINTELLPAVYDVAFPHHVHRGATGLAVSRWPS